MIVSTDIANILYKASMPVGMPVFQEGNITESGVVGPEGRVVVHVRELTPETYWHKMFAEVNFFVADLPSRNADLIRLNYIERLARKTLDGVAGTCDGTPYVFSVHSTSIMASEELHAHYVNVKVLFKSLNTK